MISTRRNALLLFGHVVRCEFLIFLRRCSMPMCLRSHIHTPTKRIHRAAFKRKARPDACSFPFWNCLSSLKRLPCVRMYFGVFTCFRKSVPLSGQLPCLKNSRPIGFCTVFLRARTARREGSGGRGRGRCRTRRNGESAGGQVSYTLE